jgi:hypothetical protein
MPLDHHYAPDFGRGRPLALLITLFMCYSTFSKRNPNFSKPGQVRPSSRQVFPSKKIWISLDFLVRNEPFQGIVATPQDKKSFFRSFPAIAFRRPPSSSTEWNILPRLSIFARKTCPVRDSVGFS